MLLRLSLVVAIVAGLAALYFSHFNVGERINVLNQELERAESQATQAQSDAQRARENERKARQDLETTTLELADRTSALEMTAARLAEQEKRANKLFEDTARIEEDLKRAQQLVSAYQATGMNPQQVSNLRDQLVKVADARDTFEKEASMLLRRAEDLARRLARYEGPQDEPVELPAGLVGRVVAVDPRYDFVVLDIGADDGVKPDGQLLVNRNGQLVARVQVTRVEQNRSIANVLPQWKQDDVMEGDVVFY